MSGKRLLLTLPLLAAVLATFMFVPSRESLSFYSVPPPAAIAVDPQEQILLSAERDASVTFTGRGLDSDLQGWLVPEALPRRAIIATLPIYNRLRDIELRGDYAYLLTGRADLLLVDLRDPRTPTVVNAVQGEGSSLHFALRDDLAFVAAGGAGLHIIELPVERPGRQLASVKGAAPALDVAVKEHWAFVARGKGGVSVYDVSNPTAPRHIGGISFRGRALALATWGDYLAVSLDRDDAGIAIFDISVPARPRRISSLALGGDICVTFAVREDGRGLVVTNGKDTAGPGLLHAVDLQIPAAPRIVSSQPLSGKASHIDWDGEHALIAAGSNGLQLFETPPGGAPRLAAKYPLSGSIFAAASHGDTAWLCESDGTLIGFALNADSGITPLEVVSSVNPLLEPLIADGLLIVADTLRTLHFFAQGEGGGEPQPLANLTLPGVIRHLHLAGKVLVVSCQQVNDDAYGDGELVTVDLGNRSAPRILARKSFRGAPLPVGVHRNVLALLAPKVASNSKSSPGELILLDISDPARAETLSTTPLPLFPVGANLDRNRLFLITAAGDVSIFALDDPRYPAKLGGMTMPWLEKSSWTCGWVEMIPWGEMLLISSPLAGVKLVYVGDGARPVLLGTIETDGSVTSLAHSDDLLLVGRRGKGVLVISLASPWQPKVLGNWPLPGMHLKLAVDGGVLWYISYNGRGIHAIPLPRHLAVRGARNGSRATVTIPGGVSSGDYSLWLESDGATCELPAQLRITPRARS